MAALTQRLTKLEKAALSSCEVRIERGLQTFYEVGASLLQIRDGRLYRATHGTFEEYCKQRWSMERQRAYQLIAAADVHSSLTTIVDILPTNEAQARMLLRVPEPLRPVVWQEVVRTAPNGKITAAHVQKTIKSLLAPIDSQTGLRTSDSAEWYTPDEVIKPLIEFFDTIDLDPCSNSHESPNIPAESYYTKADNGLAQVWEGRVFVNPPYGDEIGQWIEKAVRSYRPVRWSEEPEVEPVRTEAIVMLVPARTDTAWFQPLWPYPLCFVRGRLKFKNMDDKDNGAPFPSVVAYLGTDVDGFAKSFGHLGTIVTERGTGGV